MAKPTFTILPASAPALLQGGGSRGGTITGIKAFENAAEGSDVTSESFSSVISAAAPKPGL